MAKKRFEAVLGGEEGDRPTVELPFDVRATYGSARPKLKVTVNGVELRTTVAIYGGRSYVGFRKEVRDAAGIAVGDRIRVEIEADTAPREVTVPADLGRALTKDRAAKKIFEGLAFTHRKEFVQWVEGAKKAETRERRVAKAIEMLHEKKTL
jgi:hypothetical protein